MAAELEIAMHFITSMAGGSQPCSATFVDNVGNESPGKTPLKIDDNTFVFGHASDWYKMVSVDSLGNKIENRYMSSGSELTAANWATANPGGSYSATNVQLCEEGHSAQYTALCPLPNLNPNPYLSLKFGNFFRCQIQMPSDL